MDVALIKKIADVYNGLSSQEQQAFERIFVDPVSVRNILDQHGHVHVGKEKVFATEDYDKVRFQESPFNQVVVFDPEIVRPHGIQLLPLKKGQGTFLQTVQNTLSQKRFPALGVITLYALRCEGKLITSLLKSLSKLMKVQALESDARVFSGQVVRIVPSSMDVVVCFESGHLYFFPFNQVVVRDKDFVLTAVLK